ncbi:MAG TPA: DNA polymerase III subunit gamma/tau [Gemmatimonadales bacterium]|nr:DNA polymerase III subunit gamma/tau [Gemmatimonadales bacterium]
MTIALARRYRPKRFADLLVQDHVAAVLRGAVARGRIGHGYLLTGPRGVGKTTAARILAMALNCPNRDPSGDPCGECDNCQRVWNGAANLDVVEIDAASNRGVDDARDLRERAMYAASREGHYKVYIVDEAHMLTREAWNALLKVLEEPPPGVVFVFATTEPQKIAAAAAPVLSRLQRFDFRRIGPAAIRDRLRQVLEAEGIAADDDALTLIARHADGGMRDALSVLDQCLSFGEGAVSAARVRDVLGLVGDELYVEILGLVVDRRPEGVFPLVDRLVNAGADLAEFMGGAGETLRALLMLQLGNEPEGLTEAMRQALEAERQRLEPGDVLRMLRLLADSETAIRRSVNPRLIVETLLLRWTMLDRIVDLAQVLGATGGTEPTGGGSPRVPAVARPDPEPAGAAARPEATPAGAAARPSPGTGMPVGSGANPAEARRSESNAPAVVAGPPAMPVPAASSHGDVLPTTLEAIRVNWPEIVAEVRERSRFLGEALFHTAPSALELPWVTVELSEPNPLFAERLQAQAHAVEEVLSRALGQAARLRVTEAAPGGTAPPAKPRKLTEAGLKADRLRAFRSKDPALDTAADALDLEIVD